MYILSLNLRKGAKDLIETKCREYYLSARLYRWTYYFTRTLTALSSAILPFFVNNNHLVTTILALIIVLCVAIDAVFDPKSNYRILSKATDILTIANLKQKGEYEKYKAQLDILVDVEEKKLEKLVDLEAVKAKGKKE